MTARADLVHGLVRGVARRSCPAAMLRSTFSTTTIASSTTMPMASTRPNRVRLLSEKPNAAITAKVPISETGMATIGMSAVRQDCRKTMTTSDDEQQRLEQRLVDRVDRLRR